jgi:hypothetical protein
MPRGVKRPSTPEDFMSKIEKTDTCWIWMGSKDKNGYGQFMVNYKNVRAHRYAYSQLKGTIPDGLILRHSCDTPACVNPEHLMVGTHKENARDRVNRGRNRDQRGGKNNKAKLTEDKVLAIRDDDRIQLEIARDYGVSQQTVSDIKRKRIWSWL